MKESQHQTNMQRLCTNENSKRIVHTTHRSKQSTYNTAGSTTLISSGITHKNNWDKKLNQATDEETTNLEF